MEENPGGNCSAGNRDLYRFYSSVMIIEFALALPLNLSVIYLFVFKLRFWKSKSNNIFLFNMVLADVLLLVCLPLRAGKFLRGERRNEGAACRVVVFLLFLNRGASIAFLTIISIDRYYSVVHSGLKNASRMRERSALVSVLIWVCLFPLTIPTMLKSLDCCDDDGADGNAGNADVAVDVVVVLRELVFFSQVLVPFGVLVYCTARITERLRAKGVGDRSKLRRAVFLVTLVILVFSVCFLPSAGSRLVLLITKARRLTVAEEISVQVYDGLMCLSYLDCLLDPFVYCLSSTKFKNLYLWTFFPFLMKQHHAEHHRHP